MYGSVGGERNAGIPYWIVFVLPRVFPDKLPGPGGTPRSDCRGSRATSCRSDSPPRTIGFRARGPELRGVPHRELSHQAEREPDVHPHRPGPHLQSRGVLPLHRRLRKGSALQRRHADERDQPGQAESSPGSTSRSTAIVLIPLTRKAPARAGEAIRLDLHPRPAAVARLGARPRRRDEPHQVLPDHVAAGQHPRPHRHAVGLEPEEVQESRRARA